MANNKEARRKEEAKILKAKEDSTKAVEWYQPTVKSLPESTISFFENYVGIKGEEAIKDHIYRVRDMAWRM